MSTTNTDPIQIEIARIQAMGDRIEALCDRIEARLDAQDAAHAETARTLLRLTEAMEAGPEAADGERKTYADFEFDNPRHPGDLRTHWRNLLNAGEGCAANRLEHSETYGNSPYRFRCAHTRAPVTAAEIRAAVEAPLVVLGQGTSRTEVRL